jgi:hypothetical protein
MTISVNHDIIDGAPAARFTQRLKELIESGYALSDFCACAQVSSFARMDDMW